MLSFAAFAPHPPIIIPQIGQDDLKYCAKTKDAMQELAERVAHHDLDTLIVISPHTTLSPESMTVSYNSNAKGDFSHFNHPEISFSAEIDIELAEKIIKKAKKSGIKTQPLLHDDNFFLDHGVLVPLYYLLESIPSSCKLIVVGFSNASRAEHFSFGQSISEIADNSDQHIGILASGDLSHRILENGSEMVGKKFDQLVTGAISSLDTEAIFNIDSDLQEEAGECGYRSLLVLLGALDKKTVEPQLLSYEAPFGVGYMVAEFKIDT